MIKLRGLLLFLAGIHGALAVAAGAYAAHGLDDASLAAARELVDKASRYQLVHAVAVLAALAVPSVGGSRWLLTAATAFCLGMFFFCGALYAISLAGWAAAPLAPVGGTLFIFGWLCVAVAGGRMARRAV